MAPSFDDTPAGFASPRTAAGRAVIESATHRLTVEFLASGAARMLLEPRPAAQRIRDLSWAVVDRRLEASAPEVRTTDEGFDLLGLRLHVHVAASGSLHVKEAADGTEILALPAEGLFASEGRCGAEIALAPGERIYGLGEKTGPMNKRGHVYRFWNTDHWLYERDTDPIYKSVPMWLGVRGARVHGVFVECPGPGVLDLGKTIEDRAVFRGEMPRLDLTVLPGPDARGVVAAWSRLVGAPPMPPRWALGYHQCRYSYRSADRVRELAETFRRKGIPCDGLWLDIHYMEAFRSFTFDPDHFPDPDALHADLAELGIRTVAIVDPGLPEVEDYAPYVEGLEGGHFVREPDGTPVKAEVWPGICAFPDFTSERTRTWWGELFRPLVEAGISGFWVDMNEPATFGGRGGGTLAGDVRHEGDHGASDHAAVHNVYGHLMARATREGLEQLRPGERPFLLSRSAYAGTGRFAATWSGDNRSTWEDLRASVGMALNAGMSGFPLYGPDVGGFGGTPTPEMFLRWVQLGAVLGLFRVHSALGTPDQEPWSFGHDFELRIREAIELRYRLLSYLESLHREAAAGGLPPTRPTWTAWPEDGRFSDREDLLLLGEDLLVAPVLEEGVRQRRVPVPPGLWFTFPEGQRLPEERGEVTLEAGLDDPLPMLVRGGAILPFDPPRGSTAEPLGVERSLLVFPGGVGSHELVEDDGISSAGAERRIRLDARTHDGVLEVRIGAPEGEGEGCESLVLECAGLPAHPLAIEWDGDRTAVQEKPDAAVRWDKATERLFVRVPVTGLPVIVRIPCSGDLTIRRERAVVVRRTPHVPPRFSRAPDLRLEGPAHHAAVAWWTPKRLRAGVHFRWRPEDLHVSVIVRDDTPAPPCQNAQDDGLYFVFRAGGDPAGAIIRLHVPTPEEGTAVRRLEGSAWRPETGAKALVSREGGTTRYLVRIPVELLEVEALATDMVLPADLSVQHSDRTGRRGLLEWIGGHAHPDHPGGSLVLGDPRH